MSLRQSQRAIALLLPLHSLCRLLALPFCVLSRSSSLSLHLPAYLARAAALALAPCRHRRTVSSCLCIPSHGAPTNAWEPASCPKCLDRAPAFDAHHDVLRSTRRSFTAAFWISHVLAPAMAPASTADASSVPLADYFFISGIESSQVYDPRSQPTSLNGLSSPLSSPPPVDVDETIEEDLALETDSIRPKSQDGLANGDGTKRRSARLSFEHRSSVSTIIGPESKQSASNRSSATIKGPQVGGSGLSDVDFENALRKFASERDTFLEEIQFTAGIAKQNRPTPTKPRVRPQRVQQTEENGGNLRSGVGSIRRRLSTMQSSLKRQPSMARQGKRV